jgi:hypothetical protein
MSNSKHIIKSTRKIKCLGNCVSTGEYYLHPITLELSKNKSEKSHVCPSELHYVNNEPRYAKICDKNNISQLDIQKFMTLPYLNLNLEQMLNIYKINTIESLIKWVDNKIEEDVPFQYINRIINIWIKLYYNDLLSNNNILVSLYNSINKKYWHKNKIENIDSFIKNWFKNKHEDDFSFNLGKDLFNYINKN